MKTVDEILKWQGFGNGFGKWESKCRVRVYEHDERIVVLLTELEDNEGTSVTNCIENVAGLVLANHKLAETQAGMAKLVFIQHLMQRVTEGLAKKRLLEEFHQVGFGVQIVPNKLDPKRGDCKFINPEWKPLKKAHVESLIGEEVGL